MIEYADSIPNDQKPLVGGRIKSPDAYRETLKGSRFIFTVAQNNTKLHMPFWKTLKRMSKKLEAKLCVSKCSYNKNGWQQVTAESEGVWYAEEIIPHIIDNEVKVAKGLLFCGNLDILPTAVTPLQGLDNHTGPHSAIIPHVKMQMKSLATMKSHPAKLLYTTGAVTQRNYIQRRAGQLAEYHHVYGAMYVEVDSDGQWFARQLNSDDAGIVFDLGHVWGPTFDRVVDTAERPLITLGDIHFEKLCPDTFMGAMDMMTALKPEGVFLHDLIDFTARNHHNIDDWHFIVDRMAARQESIEGMFAGVAKFLHSLITAYPSTTFYVVRSNHDEAFNKWVHSRQKWPDAKNLRYWHEVNAAALSSIERGKSFDAFEWAIEKAASKSGFSVSDRVRFIQEDESFVLREIEHGMHGHLGPNGVRATPRNFKQIGRRVNTGHTHSAGIIDGVWTGGVLGSLDMGYNKGPSSWSASSILTHINGKRQIVTQNKRKWRA
jgi:hypothetical protein